MKKQSSSPHLAYLLATSRTETSPAASRQQIKTAREYVRYKPDAHVLAEALQAEPNWFVTHDKEHFLKQRDRIVLPFEMGTPSDLIQRLKNDFTLL